MRYFLFIILLFNIILVDTVFARKRLIVGAYNFPAYLFEKKYEGITIDTVKILNEMQQEYYFNIKIISSVTRYKEIEEKNIDLILYEDKLWSWEKYKNLVDFTDVVVEGAEIYVCLKEKCKNDDYLNEIKKLKILAFYGYHYAFANYNSSQEYLRKNFKIEFSNSHISNLDKLVVGRGDIALVSNSFYNYYVKINEDKKDLIKSLDKVDQTYNLRFLLRKNDKLSIDNLNKLVNNLKNSKNWQDLKNKWSL